MFYDPFKLFATDEVAEVKGKAFTEEFGGGATFIIARAGNPAYQREIQAEYKAHEHTLQRGQAKDATPEEKEEADKLSFKLIGRVMARTVLLGWDARVRPGNQDFPYSHENAEKLLSVKEFRNKISDIAGDYKKFLLEQEAANEKNSVTTSAGTSSGGQASTTSEGSTAKLA